MSQKLSELVRHFTGVKFPRVKTKVEARRESAKKAARTRKRQKRQAALEAEKIGEAA